MSSEFDHPASGSPAICPWCGVDTKLRLQGDGAGGTAVQCTTCGARGPVVQITTNFEDADRDAVARWVAQSSPPFTIPPDTVERLRRTIALQQVMAGVALDEQTSLSVQLRDLQALLKAFGGYISFEIPPGGAAG